MSSPEKKLRSEINDYLLKLNPMLINFQWRTSLKMLQEARMLDINEAVYKENASFSTQSRFYVYDDDAIYDPRYIYTKKNEPSYDTLKKAIDHFQNKIHQELTTKFQPLKAKIELDIKQHPENKQEYEKILQYMAKQEKFVNTIFQGITEDLTGLLEKINSRNVSEEELQTFRNSFISINALEKANPLTPTPWEELKKTLGPHP